MSTNDDDLYGDLYGNDNQDQFPGFDGTEEEPEEPPKPKVTELVPPPTTAKTGTPSVPETKTTPAVQVKKEEPKPVTKRDEPETNPIPTFTDEGGSSYSSQGAHKYGHGGNADTNSRSTQGFSVNPGGANQAHQGIETLGGNDSVRPSNMRDEGKMFVGGLNWDTTDEGLRNYFSQFGKIEACTIMRDPAGRSRGFAFLTFEDPAAVNKVMVQEHFLDGKIIDPKRAIPRTEHQRTVKMFVGGLAPSVSTDSMREYFSQFGNVIDATVMVDRDSSRSKGFGFVTFDDQSGAERLFGMPGLQIDGKMIEVKMAQPRAGMATDRAATANMNNNRGAMPATNMNMAGGNTPFDPQALATLYQRMAQLAGGGQGSMSWGMNGGGMGMNPMMGMGGGAGGMGVMGAGGMMGGSGMGVPQGGGMRSFNNGMMNGSGGMGMMGDGGMGGMGGAGGAAMRGGIPRGPAAMRGGAAGGGVVPTGPSGGLGPARMGRGHQHNYHPYSR